MDFDKLLATTIEAAKTAGKMIAESRPQHVTRKEGGESLASQVLTEVDEKSQRMILEILKPTIEEFDLALLAEESEDDHSRFEKEYFWCIDPIDGTLPFIDGIPGYSVSIALVARDGTPHIGVVYDPVEHNCWHAVRGGGIFKNSKPWKLRDHGTPLQLITDRSFKNNPRFFQTLEKLELDEHSQVRMTGGAAMNAVWVLENAPACYFKFPKLGKGGGSIWDFAATACLFAEAGAVATDFAGNPLDLNRADSTFMNHRGILFATDAQLAEQIKNRLR
ncbi:inositol monophosphatase [Tichowtungia aerotolerans]|uniref:Inositol monophosphatase n=2 Tax=Tichowtungia aerotolerans TaxID=2697043 RepID=A0A6P1MH24_9BACT|nr:inositol monophosphatase [Tichowtungia aerotolerans]